MKIGLSGKAVLWMLVFIAIASLVTFYVKLWSSPKYNLTRSFEDKRWTKDGKDITNTDRNIRLSITELKIEDFIIEQIKEENTHESVAIWQTFFAKKLKNEGEEKIRSLRFCEMERCILRIEVFFKDKIIQKADFIGIDYGTGVIPIPDFFDVVGLTGKCINNGNFLEHKLAPTILIDSKKAEIISVNYAVFIDEIVNYIGGDKINRKTICDASQIELADALRGVLKEPTLLESAKSLKETYDVDLILHTNP